MDFLANITLIQAAWSAIEIQALRPLEIHHKFIINDYIPAAEAPLLCARRSAAPQQN